MSDDFSDPDDYFFKRQMDLDRASKSLEPGALFLTPEVKRLMLIRALLESGKADWALNVVKSELEALKGSNERG